MDYSQQSSTAQHGKSPRSLSSTTSSYSSYSSYGYPSDNPQNTSTASQAYYPSLGADHSSAHAAPYASAHSLGHNTSYSSTSVRSSDGRHIGYSTSRAPSASQPLYGGHEQELAGQSRSSSRSHYSGGYAHPDSRSLPQPYPPRSSSQSQHFVLTPVQSMQGYHGHGGPIPQPSSSPPDSIERFPCDQCSKTFSRAHDRKRHYETQHSSHPPSHKCQYCQKEFSRADSLKRHVDNGCPGAAQLQGTSPT